MISGKAFSLYSKALFSGPVRSLITWEGCSPYSSVIIESSWSSTMNGHPDGFLWFVGLLFSSGRGAPGQCMKSRSQVRRRGEGGADERRGG